MVRVSAADAFEMFSLLMVMVNMPAREAFLAGIGRLEPRDLDPELLVEVFELGFKQGAAGVGER